MPPPISAEELTRGLREPNSEEQGLAEEGGEKRDWPRGSGLEDARFSVGRGHPSWRDREVESLKLGWKRGGGDFGRDIGGQGKLSPSATSPPAAQ